MHKFARFLTIIIIMAFVCQQKDCKLWAESECSCPDQFRLCVYHNNKHHESSDCNTRSLKKELSEGFTKVKENERILDQIKGDLISTADRMIASILQMVYDGVNMIETKKIEVNDWMRLNEDKNIEDILGSFKFLKIKERSLKKVMKSMKNVLSLQKLNNKELNEEVCGLKGQNGYLQAECEKIKFSYLELAKNIREGNYSLSDYEKELKDIKATKEDLEKELLESKKDLKEIKEKVRTDEVDKAVRAEQEALKAKMDRDQANRLRKLKEERKTEKDAKKKLDREKAENDEKTLRDERNRIEDEKKRVENEKKRVEDENTTLKNNLNEVNRIVNEEKEKYEKSVKEIEELARENKKLIDDLKNGSDGWNNEKNGLNEQINNLRGELERIERE